MEHNGVSTLFELPKCNFSTNRANLFCADKGKMRECEPCLDQTTPKYAF